MLRWDVEGDAEVDTERGMLKGIAVGDGFVLVTFFTKRISLSTKNFNKI